MNGFVLASLILYINFIQNVKVCFKTKNGSISIPKSAKLKDLLESKYAYLHFLQHANYISGISGIVLCPDPSVYILLNYKQLHYAFISHCHEFSLNSYPNS